MGIEIIGKLTQKNNGNFKLVDLEDIDYDGTGKSAKQELEKKIEDAKNSSTPYDDSAIKADIKTLKDNEVTLVKDETSMEGIKDNEYPTLTTTDKTLIGSINEVNAQFKDIAKKTITTEERAKLNSLENYDDTSVKNDIQTQKSRIDTFTTLQEGSTTGDAELIDARVGANGVAYNNVGNAIRTQIKWITSDIDKIKELKLVGKNKFDKTQQKDGYYYTSKGVLKELEGWAISEKIKANKGDILYLEVFNNMSAVHISEWDKYDNFLTWQNISTTSLDANKLSDGWYYPYSIANDNCAYIIIDIETSKNSLIQIEKNTLTGTYEEYYWYFENNTYKQLLEIIEKVNIIEKNSIDYSIFTLPYIRERKVLCNTKVNYTAIDVGEKIDRIDCNYIWEKGTKSGKSTF